MKDCSWYFFISFMEIPLEFPSGKRFMALDWITQGSYVDSCFEKLFIVCTIYTIYFIGSAELYYRYFRDAFLANFYLCGISLYRNKEPTIIRISLVLVSMHIHASFYFYYFFFDITFIFKTLQNLKLSRFISWMFSICQCVKIKARWKYWSMCLTTVQVDFRNFGFTVFNIAF